MFLILWLICGLISVAFIFAVRYVNCLSLNPSSVANWAVILTFAVTGPFGILANIYFYSATFLAGEA